MRLVQVAGMAWVYGLGKEGVGCWVVGCQFPGADGAWCLLVDIDQGIYISGFLSRWAAGGFGSVRVWGLGIIGPPGLMRMNRGTLCEAVYEE